MLKALELIGFKSFADKTRFEFGSGITVVVGPNGSGKSNVVDAVKWVLGEQSVKSLRGKEMTDVIFNGSARRHALNTAEATLTFDNSAAILPVDTPEVQITRRVYRSGEGEYFINRQPCRRRDIRDLLAGTGMGVSAYSIIEQGKVDSLLQSTPRDRRLILEEAAGISRFRIKKVESQRRLERVDQNLLRLKDIVDEVESRLRSVRLQAAKARRYRQYTSRLQELRTQVGLADWRKLSGELADLEGQLHATREESAQLEAAGDALETRQAELEQSLEDLAEAIRECEAQAGQNRERIAAREAAVEQQRGRVLDLEEELARHRRQLTAMNLKAGDLVQQRRSTAEAVRAAEAEFAKIESSLQEQRRAAGEIARRLEMLRDANEQRREGYMARMRSAAALGNDITALESQAAAHEETCRRRAAQLAELGARIQQLDTQRDGLKDQQQRIAAVIDGQQRQTEFVRRRRAQLQDEQDVAEAQADGLRQRHTRAAERQALLAELEERLEGLDAGAKEVLQRARDGEAAGVLGPVAELLQSDVRTAQLIEIALGEAAGHVVVESLPDALGHLRAAAPLSGRISLVELPRTAAGDAGEDLDGRPGVLGRADRFVETAAEFRPLARKLLGATWLVETLEAALQLAANAAGATFVTLAGEKVTPAGTVSCGPAGGATGLISRRSELRALEQTVAELERQLHGAEVRRAELQQAIDQHQRQLDTLDAEQHQAREELTQCRQQLQALEAQRQEQRRRRDVLQGEHDAAAARRSEALAQLETAQRELTAVEATLAELEAVIAGAAREIIELDQRRQQCNERTTAIQVQRAKSEERLGALRVRLQQFEADQQERRRAIDEHREQSAACAARLSAANRRILRATSEVALLYLEKERCEAETARLVAQREACQRQRHELADEAHEVRKRLKQLEAEIHAKDLSAGQLRLTRSGLAERLRDDYGIELAALEHEPSEEELHQREQVDHEIEELRRKVNNIGNVNLEALEELDALESRYQDLSSQYEDLAAAKRSLEQIIGKINADSRRMFGETLETVREHFQTLYRKLFGGGQADLVLEEGVDVLDSGVEIIARPPGKELRSISLLSGGEKTLTCVALLLAIFRSRPSPFCLLDEVDAALDEANISRFIGVLNEFLSWTQFIVVTHSKKTMTCASTLYGVTMQESGISKRVSVRFEDVSDDGEIHVQAPDDEPEDADDETQAA